MIADAHVDLLLELSYREHVLGETDVFRTTWLRELEAGGVRLQVCPVYVGIEHQPEGTLRESLRQVTSFHRAVRACPDLVVHVRTAADLDQVRRGERIGLVLAFEGVEQLGIDLWPAELFHELGLRMVGLTWNRRNAFADGAAETSSGGLSRLGRELVEHLWSLGIVLDLAHASQRTFSDLLELAGGRPVLCSHAGCKTVYDTPRNLDDDQLRAIVAARGVFGLMLHPLAIDPVARSLERVIDHLEHAASVIGVEHVCLGGDFTRRLWQVIPPPPEPKDGLMPEGLAPGAGIEGLAGSKDYPALIAALARRGWAPADIEAVTFGNLTRFLEANLR
jgi:membrane dipeptidase